jgi:hypothetical protein
MAVSLFACFCNVFQGKFLLLFFSNTIFKEHVSIETATVLSNFLLFSSLIGTISCFGIADKYGRKQLLGFSYLAIGFLLLAYSFLMLVEKDYAFWI